MATQSVRTEPSTGPPSASEGLGFRRLTAISGIVFIVTVVISMVLVGEMPSASDDATTLTEYLTEDVGSHRAGLAVIGFAVVPALLFGAGLAGVHRAADRRHDEAWSMAIAAFWVFAIGMLAVGVIIDAGLMLSRDAALTDSVLLAFWDVSIASGALMMLGFGAAAASVGIAALVHGLRSAWYGWLSVLVGILGVFGLATAVSDSDGAVALSFAMLPVFIVWVVASSVYLYRDA